MKELAIWVSWVAWAACLNVFCLVIYSNSVEQVSTVRFASPQLTISRDPKGVTDTSIVILVEPPSAYDLEVEYTVEGDVGDQIKDLQSGTLKIGAGKGSWKLPYRVDLQEMAKEQRVVVKLMRVSGAKLGETVRHDLDIPPTKQPPPGRLLASLKLESLPQILQVGPPYEISVILDRPAHKRFTLEWKNNSPQNASPCIQLSGGTIEQGDKSGKISLKILKDEKGIPEDQLEFKLQLKGTIDYDIGQANEITRKLAKSYLGPVLKLLAAPGPLQEGKKWVVTLQLSKESPEPVTVNYLIGGELAKKGQHYETPKDYKESGGSKEFQPGDKEKDVVIEILDNDTLERKDVELTFRITDVIGAAKPVANEKTVKIEDAYLRGDLLVLVPVTETLQGPWGAKVAGQIDQFINAHKHRLVGGSVYLVGPDAKMRKRHVPGKELEKIKGFDNKALLKDFFAPSLEVLRTLTDVRPNDNLKVIVLWVSDHSPWYYLDRGYVGFPKLTVPPRCEVFAFWVAEPGKVEGKDRAESRWLGAIFRKHDKKHDEVLWSLFANEDFVKRLEWCIDPGKKK